MPQQQGMPGQGDQCIYCQLIDNPDQLVTVGETDNFYAWLEVQPRAKGHTQVVPKEHIESVLNLDPKQYMEMMKLVREVAVKAKEGLGADGISIVENIEEAGGQMMPHAYISVFPRFEEDENAGTPTGAIFQHREDLQDQNKLQEIKSEMTSVTVDFEQETIKPHEESKKFKQEETEETESSEEEQPEEEKQQKEETRNEEEQEDPDIEPGESFEWV